MFCSFILTCLLYYISKIMFLFNFKVEVVRKLCRECGLDSHGSRSDLLLRLSNEMKSRQAYDKIFEKIWGASGKLKFCHK